MRERVHDVSACVCVVDMYGGSVCGYGVVGFGCVLIVGKYMVSHAHST